MNDRDLPARDELSRMIKDAYYHARDHGGTMHTAGDDAADAILASEWLAKVKQEAAAEALEEAAVDLFADEAAEREWLLYRAERIRSDAGIGGA